MMGRSAILVGLAWLAAPLGAVELQLPPGATPASEQVEAVAQVAVPTGPYRDQFLPTRTASGQKSVAAYRIAQPGLDPVALIAPLEAQIEEAGFRILLRCDTAACGGFDFRFAIEVLPPPAMFVDLGAFSYLSAVSEDEETFVSILSSRTLSEGYLQITQIVAEGAEPTVPVAPAPVAPARGPQIGTGDLARDLEVLGHVVLSDLSFATGTTDLSSGSYASLEALAEYLRANGTRRVALVGHTDASGGLDVNLRVSKARANSVRALLIGQYGVAPDQVEAEGVGYLSPKGSNLSEDGRAANRRVEAVIISTQ